MPCHWDPPEPTVEQELETGLIDLTRYLERRTPVTPYRDRLKSGQYKADKQTEATTVDPDQLPSRHAALDELATARGVIWTGDKLTVEAKQQQIRDALTQ
jgi:hypothetical protein